MLCLWILFCRYKSLWSWGTRLLSYIGSSSCELRMLCIFLFVTFIHFFWVYKVYWSAFIYLSGRKIHLFWYLAFVFNALVFKYKILAWSLELVRTGHDVLLLTMKGSEISLSLSNISFLDIELIRYFSVLCLSPQ